MSINQLFLMFWVLLFDLFWNDVIETLYMRVVVMSLVLHFSWTLIFMTLLIIFFITYVCSLLFLLFVQLFYSCYMKSSFSNFPSCLLSLLTFYYYVVLALKSYSFPTFTSSSPGNPQVVVRNVLAMPSSQLPCLDFFHCKWINFM